MGKKVSIEEMMENSGVNFYYDMLQILRNEGMLNLVDERRFELTEQGKQVSEDGKLWPKNLLD